MTALTSYVERYAAKVGGYTEAARRLDMTYQGLIRVRKHGGGIEPDKAMLIADELGEDPLKVLAAAAAQRSKSPSLKRRWEELARGAVATLCLVMAMGYSSEGTAATEATVSAESERIIGIMRTFEGVFGGASASICDISAGVFFTGRARRCF